MSKQNIFIMKNPFEVLEHRLSNIESLLLDIKHNRRSGLTDETWTIEQVATRTGLAISSIYKKTSSNEIPHFKRGKRLYFSKLAIEKWLRENPIRTSQEIESEAATRVTLS